MPDVGFRKWMGLEYRVMEDGKAIVRMPLRAEMYNNRDVAHGGVVAALADVAMGTAAAGGNYDTRMRPMVTGEFKLNYLAPARGQVLTATAEVVRAGSRMSVVRCEVETDRGVVCAAALGTFVLRRPHPNDPSHLRAQAVPREGT